MSGPNVSDRYALLKDVAHAAWHLLDDGGEIPGEPFDIVCSKRDADRLGAALTLLEASGWDPHPPPPPPPSRQNGGLLACGHWTYKGIGAGQSVGQHGLCDVGDGRQIIAKCNVEEPDAHYQARVHSAQETGA